MNKNNIYISNHCGPGPYEESVGALEESCGKATFVFTLLLNSKLDFSLKERGKD